jgi:hypothetical protein
VFAYIDNPRTGNGRQSVESATAASSRGRPVALELQAVQPGLCGGGEGAAGDLGGLLAFAAGIEHAALALLLRPSGGERSRWLASSATAKCRSAASKRRRQRASMARKRAVQPLEARSATITIRLSNGTRSS